MVYGMVQLNYLHVSQCVHGLSAHRLALGRSMPSPDDTSISIFSNPHVTFAINRVVHEETGRKSSWQGADANEPQAC